MKNKTQIDDIIEFVSQSKIPNAIELLRDYSSKHKGAFQQEYVNISSRYYRIDSEYIKDIIRREDYLVEMNRINNAIMNVYNLIKESIRKQSPKSANAETGIYRTELIGKYCEMVYHSNKPEIVRQLGAFSSFSIPNRDISDPIWKQRKGKISRSKKYHSLQQAERIWLEKIVKTSYCKLIVFPNLELDRGKLATISRIKTLIEFIESNKDIVDIITVDTKKSDERSNLLIVGNRFYCESHRADSSSGYKDTIFEWDEIKVGKEIIKFDLKFNKLLKSKKLDIFDAREQALIDLKKAIS
jgi:hypothetical protein